MSLQDFSYKWIHAFKLKKYFASLQIPIINFLKITKASEFEQLILWQGNVVLITPAGLRRDMNIVDIKI